MEIIKTKNTKRNISGFGIFKGMRSFTREDEFDSCAIKFYENNKIKSKKQK